MLSLSIMSLIRSMAPGTPLTVSSVGWIVACSAPSRSRRPSRSKESPRPELRAEMMRRSSISCLNSSFALRSSVVLSCSLSSSSSRDL